MYCVKSCKLDIYAKWGERRPKMGCDQSTIHVFHVEVDNLWINNDERTGSLAQLSTFS